MATSQSLPLLDDEKEERILALLDELPTWRVVSIVEDAVKARVAKEREEHQSFAVEFTEPYDSDDKLAGLYMMVKYWP